MHSAARIIGQERLPINRAGLRVRPTPTSDPLAVVRSPSPKLRQLTTRLPPPLTLFAPESTARSAAPVTSRR